MTGPVVAQTANLDVSPNPAHPGERVLLDGRNSTAQTAIIECDFDVDGDGQYERQSDTCLIEHTYQRPGEYDVGLRVTTTAGNQATDVAAVSIVTNEPPQPAISIAPEYPRPSESILLSAVGSSDIDGTIVAHTWTVANQNTTGESINTTFTDTGTYDIALTVTDDDGASATAHRTIDVTTNEPPKAALSVAVSTVETGERLVFSADGSTDRESAIEEFRWDLDGDGTVDARTATERIAYEPTEDGEYQATVTVVDDRGSTDSATVSYTVRATTTETPIVTPTGVVTRTPIVGSPTPAGAVIVAISPLTLAAILVILLLLAAGLGVRRTRFADETATTVRELLTRGDIRRRLSRIFSQTLVKNVAKRAIRWLSDIIEATGDGIGEAIERVGRAIKRGSRRLAEWLRRLGS